MLVDKEALHHHLQWDGDMADTMAEVALMVRVVLLVLVGVQLL